MGDNQIERLGPLDFRLGSEAQSVCAVTLDRGSIWTPRVLSHGDALAVP